MSSRLNLAPSKLLSSLLSGILLHLYLAVAVVSVVLLAGRVEAATFIERGSWGDENHRAFQHGPGSSGGRTYTAETCQAACPGYKYIGLQYPLGTTAQCFCSNSWSEVTQYGQNSCGYAQDQPCDCDPLGGTWCNYVLEVMITSTKSETETHSLEVTEDGRATQEKSRSPVNPPQRATHTLQRFTATVDQNNLHLSNTLLEKEVTVTLHVLRSSSSGGSSSGGTVSSPESSPLASTSSQNTGSSSNLSTASSEGGVTTTISSPPTETLVPSSASPEETLEPTQAPGSGEKKPTVEVTLSFNRSAADLERNRDALQGSLAKAVHVHKGDVTITSITEKTVTTTTTTTTTSSTTRAPSSEESANEADVDAAATSSGTTTTSSTTTTKTTITVVTFEIQTEQSEEELTENIRKEAQPGGSLGFFGALVDTLTLRRKSGRVLYELGWAFFFVLALIAVGVLATFGWAVFRRIYPQDHRQKSPDVQIRGGRVSVGMKYSTSTTSDNSSSLQQEGVATPAGKYNRDATDDNNDDGGDHLIDMGPSDQSDFELRDVRHNHHLAAGGSSGGSGPLDYNIAALPLSPRNGGGGGLSRDEDAAASPTAAEIFGGSDEKSDNTAYHISGDVNGTETGGHDGKSLKSSITTAKEEPTSSQQQHKEEEEDKLAVVLKQMRQRQNIAAASRLQPSREVINDDIASSYAIGNGKAERGSNGNQ